MTEQQFRDMAAKLAKVLHPMGFTIAGATDLKTFVLIPHPAAEFDPTWEEFSKFVQSIVVRANVIIPEEMAFVLKLEGEEDLVLNVGPPENKNIIN